MRDKVLRLHTCMGGGKAGMLMSAGFCAALTGRE